MASSDRRFLAWTVQDVHGHGRIRLYDVAAARVIDPVLRSSKGFSVIGGAATVVAFLPDGKSLLTLEAGPATFRLWDVASGKERRSFAAIPPKAVAIPRNAAPAEGFDVPVRLWNVATGKPGHELNQPMNVLAVPDEAGSGTVDYLGGDPLPFCTTRRAASRPTGRRWPSAATGRRPSVTGA